MVRCQLINLRDKHVTTLGPLIIVKHSLRAWWWLMNDHDKRDLLVPVVGGPCSIGLALATKCIIPQGKFFRIQWSGRDHLGEIIRRRSRRKRQPSSGASCSRTGRTGADWARIRGPVYTLFKRECAFILFIQCMRLYNHVFKNFYSAYHRVWATRCIYCTVLVGYCSTLHIIHNTLTALNYESAFLRHKLNFLWSYVFSPKLIYLIRTRRP